ncbi:MAG TPA: AI-2E family transporter [Paludibacter sp.]|nr:AI-2E family transporter [Paludibacter sp.]
MNSTRPYTFDRVVRIIIGTGVLILLFLLIKRLSDVLLPFFIALLLAYLLDPIVRFFQYKLKLKNRILSIITVLVVLGAMLTGIIISLIPNISEEVTKLAEIINLYAKGINVDTILPIAWQNEIREYLSTLNIQSVLADENIMTGIKKIAPQLWNLLNGSLSIILGFTVVFIIFLYLIFILIDYKKITDGIFDIIPIKYRPLISGIFLDMEIGMNRYFRGQAIVALIVGIMFAIGFSIMGLPLAIVFGLFVGVLNLVPYLQTIAVAPALLLGFLQSVETGQPYLRVVLWLVIIFIVVQGAQDLYLTPKIMGKVTGLHPALILLSLSIWGSLMGMIGLIIALPLTTLIISYYKRYVLKEEIPVEEEANETPNEIIVAEETDM